MHCPAIGVQCAARIRSSPARRCCCAPPMVAISPTGASDTGSPQVHVFWRTFVDEPDDETKPESEELCPVSLTQLRDHLGKRLTAYTWDALTGDWRPMRQNQ